MGRDALRYLIGIDMGTTNVKALLFDEQGNTAGEARCPSPITLLPDGGERYLSTPMYQGE